MPHTFETQPIQVEKFYTGVISNRNKLTVPIRLMGRRIVELFDAILSGSNAEISVRATLQRACGYIPYNTNPISGVPQKFYAFQQVSTGSIFPIVDTTAGVFYVPPGGSAPTSLATKTQGAQSSFFGVGNYLHIGNAEFAQKWDGGSPQGLTKWGIAIGSVNNAVGPNTAGAGVDAGGSFPWANPNNVTSAVNFATVSLTNNSAPAPPLVVQFSDGLNATTFGFAIPTTSTINGIQVTFDALVNVNPVSQAFIGLQLLKGGSLFGTQKLQRLTNTSVNTFTLGATSDLWGGTWTPNDVNGMGVQFVAYLNNSGGTPGTVTFSVRNVKVTIFGTGGPTVTLVAGTNTATQGFQYLFGFGNSNDNNISNPSPASASIKPVAQGVQISLTASTDPQVNQIRVFRTTDTGTGAVFFELPTSPYPNTTANVVDNAADTALQVTQVVVVGSLAFSPPPPGLVNLEWYAGRMWGSVGNLLYFSAGPDNFPMGKGTSNWPPGNVFELPTTIVKNVALNGGNGMLVVTLDGIHIVQGISNPGFTVNKWLSDVGARQQNAVDTDGSNIFIYTSDNQFLRISAQGIEELSQNISDQTDALDATKVYVTQHRSGSQDSRVFLTDGSTKWIPYNLMMGAWEPAKTPADGSGMGAISSIEITPGVFKLLKGSTKAGSIIQQRDLNTFSDNNVSYPWNAVFGNIPLADPTQLANVESIVLRQTIAGGMGSVSILPNDTAGKFIPITTSQPEPPEANTTPVGYQARKFYLGDSAAWSQMTHVQVQFSFPAEAAQNEILSWGIFPNQSGDQPVGTIPAIQGR